MSKRWLAGLLFALLFAVAGGAQAAVTITIFNMPSAGRPDWFKAGIDAFMAQNPDIKVEQISGWLDKYTVMAAGGTAPDVLNYDAQYLPSLVTQGLLMPLDSFTNKDFDTSPYIPATLDALKWHGQLYALPRAVDILGVRYNRDILQDRAVAFPDGKWTWDDLVTNGKKLTVSDAAGNVTQYGFVDKWRNSLIAPVYVWEAGGRFWNADFTKTLIDSPEAARAFQYWYDLYYTNHIGPRLDDEGWTAAPWDLFKQSKVAILQGVRSRISPLDHSVSMGVAPTFIGPAGRASGFTLDFLAVSATSRHAEAAWRLVKFLASREGFAAGRASNQTQGVYGLLSPIGEQAAEQLKNDAEPGGEWWLKLTELARISPSTHPADPKLRLSGPDWDQVTKGTAIATSLHSVAGATNAQIADLIKHGTKW